MKISPINDQRGIAHLGLILVIVILIGAVSFAAWRVMQKDKESDNASAINASNLKCDIDDKDLCKFYTSWKAQKYYKVVTVDTSDGQTTNSTYESAGDDRFRMVTSGENGFEMIVIGDTTYTKDPADGKWWKQTTKPDEQQNYDMGDSFDFSEPTEEATEDKTTYKKISKEACGDLTCFKYQVIDPNAPDQTDYIWFDDDEYQLRRMTSESPDSKSEMTFSYDKIDIKAPTDVKEVPAGQHIVPGMSEPMTMPSEADMQQLMQSYGQ